MDSPPCVIKRRPSPFDAKTDSLVKTSNNFAPISALVISIVGAFSKFPCPENKAFAASSALSAVSYTHLKVIFNLTN